MKKSLFATLRMFILVFLVPMLSLSLASCNPDNGEYTGDDGKDGDISESVVFALIHKADTISCEADTIEIELNSTVGFEYRIHRGSSWLSECETNDGTSTKLQFVVAENKSHQSRKAEIIFSNSEYVLTDTFTLIQEANPEAFIPVDLGLSVYWATYNLGAQSPEEVGKFYAFGELEEKEEYTDANYEHYINNEWKLIGKQYSIGGTEYDAAHVQLGDGWRIPQTSEVDDLIYKCEWEWAELNGVEGYKITGPNKNSIFLPATGFKNGTEITMEGQGFYWTSSLQVDTRPYTKAYNLYFTPNKKTRYPEWRSHGNVIRPVKSIY